MSNTLLQNSHGTRPQVIQDDVFPEGIVDLDFADEAGTLLIGTANGQITLLRQSGELIRTARNFNDLRKLVWANSGNFGAAIRGSTKLVCFGADLKPVWDVQLTAKILGLAISPHGSHLAITADSGRTHVVTTDKKEIATFDTPRPLDFVRFLQESPRILGAAEFGHLCCHELDGSEVWEERILNNVGAMDVTADGRRIFLAAFNHGIQVMNSTGKQRGSFAVDGIPNSVSVSAIRNRVAVTTLESRIYWLNLDGDVIWAVDFSMDPPISLRTGPLGERLFVTTQSGRLLQLEW